MNATVTRETVPSRRWGVSYQSEACLARALRYLTSVIPAQQYRAPRSRYSGFPGTIRSAGVAFVSHPLSHVIRSGPGDIECGY
jgi:hypothetical protein